MIIMSLYEVKRIIDLANRLTSRNRGYDKDMSNDPTDIKTEEIMSDEEDAKYMDDMVMDDMMSNQGDDDLS
jgi:hypothetical protein